ncbi:MAG: FAD-binding protein [Acidobacteriota bacterium]|nr:FAD-binding protein [Acidobacteriota bacterium]
MMEINTDILIIGAGGAGMYAALAGAREGASVLLIDKNMVGRGGATVMAQMTVAVAIGHQEPDNWEMHFSDTVKSGHGICNEELTKLLCVNGPERIMEMDSWKVGWAQKDGTILQVSAPGHSRKRCVYVDFLNTGPALASTLRKQVKREEKIRTISNLVITDILVDEGRAVGAIGMNIVTAKPVALSCKAVILTTGGLSKLYTRNSGSANMGGDGYALALRAGAELTDMEFVQFFPIAHLAPRLVGMDPIMWDPFRYKLGGRLLNGDFEEFVDRYGSKDQGIYRVPRDLASYAILKEVEAGRGSTHGGAYLDFQHVSEAELRNAFGPVIDRLLANGIDLTQMPIEVAPMAHYQMGGVRIKKSMQTCIDGLYAAGEVAGGVNGANRLSGNAITEALVFGELAGRLGARKILGKAIQNSAQHFTNLATVHMEKLKSLTSRSQSRGTPTVSAIQQRLKQIMNEHVGPLRNATGLKTALETIQELRQEVLPKLSLSKLHPFNMDIQDWLELRNMLATAEMVAQSALLRNESRGAHQREDFPAQDPKWEKNQVVSLERNKLTIRSEPVVRLTT